MPQKASGYAVFEPKFEPGAFEYETVMLLGPTLFSAIVAYIHRVRTILYACIHASHAHSCTHKEKQHIHTHKARKFITYGITILSLSSFCYNFPENHATNGKCTSCKLCFIPSLLLFRDKISFRIIFTELSTGYAQGTHASDRAMCPLFVF
jgi:hypothetical protein